MAVGPNTMIIVLTTMDNTRRMSTLGSLDLLLLDLFFFGLLLAVPEDPGVHPDDHGLAA